jgi:glutamine amidotransferase
MCELLGMSFNRTVNPKISFKGFQKRGKNNPDGWGIAYYPDKSVQIFKEHIQINASKFADFLKNYSFMNSKIFIAHVRRTSVGENSHKNTHPFCRELNGKEYLFAHNGTICNFNKLNLGRFKPIGETDSEYIFCHLLDFIREKEIKNWNIDDVQSLEKEIKKINKKGTLNCLFADGEHLFCYHDKNGYNSLHFIQRKTPYRKIVLKDLDWKIDLKEEKTPDQTGYIIATKPLSNENWIEFKKGELIVFKNGKMIYSNHRDI